MRCRYREKIVRYGDYMDVSIYPVFSTKFKNGRRSKFRPSSDGQAALNRWNSVQKLHRLIAANMTSKDIKCELTYKTEPESIEQAEKNVYNFFRRMKRLYAKRGLPEFKYFSRIEQGKKSGRFHHHIIITGGILPQELAEVWGLGYVRRVQPLQFGQTGIDGLAGYYCGFKKGDEIEDSITYKRWSCSKNMIKPEEPKPNDYRYTQKQVKELNSVKDDYRELEKLYPGYFCGAVLSLNDINPFNDGYYLTMRFYKKNAKLTY